MATIKVIQLKTKIKSEDATLGKYENPKLHYFHINVDNKLDSKLSPRPIIKHAVTAIFDTPSRTIGLDFVNANFNLYNIYENEINFFSGPIIIDDSSNILTRYNGPYRVTLRGDYNCSSIYIPQLNTLSTQKATTKDVWIDNIGELCDASTCYHFGFNNAGGKLEDFLKYKNNVAYTLYINNGTVSGNISKIVSNMPNLRDIKLLYLDNIYGNIQDFYPMTHSELQSINITGSENISGILDNLIERAAYASFSFKTTVYVTTNNKITFRGVNRPNEYKLEFQKDIRSCDIYYDNQKIANCTWNGHKSIWTDYV